jgi:hypothetical protein
MLKTETFKSKTFKVAVSGLLGAALAYTTGQIDLITAIGAGIVSLLGIAGRDSVSKVVEQLEKMDKG